MFQILAFGLALGAASGLAGCLFPTASGLVISGLVLVGGLLWITHRRGTFIAATMMLLGFGFGALVTYDQVANSWWVGWVTTKRAQMADPSAYSRKADLAATVAVGEIRGRESRSAVAAIMSAASSSTSTYTTTSMTASGATTVTTVMTGSQALEFLERTVIQDREFNRRLEAVRENLIVPPPPADPPLSSKQAVVPLPPATASVRPIVVTTTVVASRDTKVDASVLEKGWTIIPKSIGGCRAIRVRGGPGEAWRILNTEDFVSVESVGPKKPNALFIALDERAADDTTATVVLVFCPPGMKPSVARNASE